MVRRASDASRSDDLSNSHRTRSSDGRRTQWPCSSWSAAAAPPPPRSRKRHFRRSLPAKQQCTRVLGRLYWAAHGRTTRAAVHSHRARRRGAPLRLVRYGVCFGGVLLQGLVTGASLWPIDGVRCVCWRGWSLKAWPRTDAGGTTRPALDPLGSFERACSAFFLYQGRAPQPYMPIYIGGMGLFI